MKRVISIGQYAAFLDMIETILPDALQARVVGGAVELNPHAARALTNEVRNWGRIPLTEEQEALLDEIAPINYR